MDSYTHLTPAEKKLEEADRKRRYKDDPWKEELSGRIANMEEQYVSMQEALRVNTQMTATVVQKTENIIELFEAGRGAVKVLKWIGVAAKWFTVVTAAFAVYFAMLKIGGKP